MEVPTRRHLDDIRRMMKGDACIGRGSDNEELSKSMFCNSYKVATRGRTLAIQLFVEHLHADRFW